MRGEEEEMGMGFVSLQNIVCACMKLSNVVIQFYKYYYIQRDRTFAGFHNN